MPKKNAIIAERITANRIVILALYIRRKEYQVPLFLTPLQKMGIAVYTCSTVLV
jgi:hypothetical protein